MKYGFYILNCNCCFSFYIFDFGYSIFTFVQGGHMSGFGTPYGQTPMVNQAVDMAMAYAMMPKDPAIEGQKRALLKQTTVALVQTYKSFIADADAQWDRRSATFAEAAKKVSITLEDYDPYKRGLAKYDKEVQGWQDCIEAEQAVLRSLK